VICSEPEQDYGIDLCLRAVRARGRRYTDVSGQIDLQVKSTTRANVSETAVSYDLEVKNYVDLREEGDNCPRFLVLVVMPEDEAQWLTQTAEELIVRHCAYWVSLVGHPPTASRTTVRIAVPRSNVFSVEALQSLLARLQGRKRP
jgi:hypothetical protein